MIKAGIIGGAGYTAGELIRILINHPEVSIQYITSRSQEGKKIYDVHKDLQGDIELSFTGDISDQPQPDILFLCLGHGHTKRFFEEYQIPQHVRCIDLSMDFRHKDASVFQGREFVYGLPELNFSRIVEASNIANPGCFATAIELALLPLAHSGQLNDEIHVNAITGSTGAGQSLTDTTHFSWRNNNVSVYKPFNHQHEKEILESIKTLQTGFDQGLNFIPVRGNFTRGIFSSVYTKTNLNIADLNKMYLDYYKEAPFTIVSEGELDLKQVVNTSKCLLHLEKHGDRILITSVIDNLLKGASGQAVQNMNIMFGLDQKTGLNLKATYF